MNEMTYPEACKVINDLADKLRAAGFALGDKKPRKKAEVVDA